MAGKFHVLVVEDDPDKQLLLKVALQMAGWEVRTADDGEAGLAAVESYPPDLIITDVMMPRMDGYELVRRVRANPATRFIPIIIQTALRKEAQDERRGAEVGALGYIVDPTDIDLLLARARTLLDFKNYLDTCEEEAFTDHLTGLANRRRFERQLEREVERTLRYNRHFCLLLLDIDHFKSVNDGFGHDAGDEVLRRLAKTLQAETRGIDLAARIGGEEFAVILPETDLEGAMDVAERLRAAISSAEIPPVGRVTASFGVAEFPVCAPTGRELLAATDAALYEAKNAGRNRIERAALSSSEAEANSHPTADV
ncbi:MAG: diguanylate cyclase [Acidobacteriota bacterium]|nr:diguanylate cyclase [Acidobacteriota bacterium]